ncbi:hypothetical protein MHYP_G00106900 [Metynnis hypsauchen]
MYVLLHFLHLLLQYRDDSRFLPFHRHFLFKHGSGSSSLLSAANQNYPLTSNTVYSPPPRPLPRSNFSRPMFTFNKPYKCCNWKCTALSATAITVTLALLLTYVIVLASNVTTKVPHRISDTEKYAVSLPTHVSNLLAQAGLRIPASEL